MEKKKLNIDWIKGAILFVCAGIVPVIVRMARLHPRTSEYGLVRAQWDITDAFSYNKMSVLMIMGALLALYALTDMWGREPKKAIKRAENWLVILFLGLSFISALASPYKDVSFNGASERFEGFWMWAVYMLLFAEAKIFVENKQSLFVLTASIAFGAMLVGGIGFLQYIGHNPFEWESVRKLIMGEVKGSFSMRFSSVFSTLYNPNCVGIYTGMLCPFFLIAGIAAPVKKWYKYVMLILAAILGVCLFGCESVGGLLGLGAGLFVAAVIAAVYFVKRAGKKGIVAAAVSAVCLVVGAAVILSGNSVLSQKINIIRETVKNPASAESPFFFKYIAMEGENGHTAVITTQEGDIEITVENNEKKVEFYDGNERREIELVKAAEVPAGFEESYSMELPGLVESRLNITSEGFMEFKGGDGKNSNTSFYFDISDGDLTYTNVFGEPIDLDKEYPSIGFEGMERLGSNRGYIWSRSIPLVFKHILIGAGPDCYEFDFPQKDVLSKLEILGNPNVIIDKPHSFYIQVAVNSGLIALISLIALFVLYFVNTVRAVMKSSDKTLLGLRLGAAAGVIGYLAAVATTDSVVSVSPVFWILLGLGFAVNRLTEE